MAAPMIDAAMCERLVTAATRNCSVTASPPATVPVGPQPEWDALANSFASLSAAFAWGSIALALVAIIAALGWGYLVKRWAEDAARQETENCVKKQMDAWLADEAPQIIRKHVELLQNASLGTDDDAKAADEMGKEAG